MHSHGPPIERHLGFWNRKAVARPLCDFFVGGLFPLGRFRDGLGEGSLTAEMIVPEAFVEYHRDIGFLVPVRSDLARSVCPFYAIPWLEAIMGCPIHVDLETNSIGALPSVTALEDLERIADAALDPRNPWFLKLLEYESVLVEAFGSMCPVSLPLMRGLTDMIGAMLGGSRMVMEFVDHPHRVERLVDLCADVWLQTARALLSLIQPFQGYYSNVRMVGSPEPCVVLQEDNAALLSPSLFKEIVFPHDERILSEFDYTLFHTHTSSLHIVLSPLVASPAVRGIESAWDRPPFGPPVESMLSAYRRIQESEKALFILAVDCPGAVELELLKLLSPRGLAILLEASSEREGHILVDLLESGWADVDG